MGASGKTRLFISDDLPGIGEAVREIFPSSSRQLCVLHVVRDSLAKVRKRDRGEMAQDLKAIYGADTVEQAHRALRALEEKWGGKYPGLVAKWPERGHAPPELLDHPKAIRPYLYTTDRPERLMKELKQRTKVVEVFCGPGALQKLVYLVLVQENERLLGRRLRGFTEIQMGSDHAPETH